jgi:plastocyanin
MNSMFNKKTPGKILGYFLALAIVLFSIPAMSADYTVSTSGFTFDQSELPVDGIEVGDVITFTNLAPNHNVVIFTSDEYPDGNSLATSGVPSTDVDSWSWTCTSEGSYDYVCTPHAPSMAGSFSANAPPIAGCIDETACNYDVTAEQDNGSCT